MPSRPPAPSATATTLQPCLLDRLTDDQPGSPGDLRGTRGVALTRYREAVLRDLRWLLNAKSHLPDEGLAEFPEVERSVYNFGLLDPAGQGTDAASVARIEQELRAAILRFEPRIDAASLQVRALRADEMPRASPNVLGFEIVGELWASPLPERFHVKTEFNLETGRCHF